MERFDEHVSGLFRGRFADKVERYCDLDFLTFFYDIKIDMEDSAVDRMDLHIFDERLFVSPDTAERDDGGLTRRFPRALELACIDGDGGRLFFRPIENSRHCTARTQRICAFSFLPRQYLKREHHGREYTYFEAFCNRV